MDWLRVALRALLLREKESAADGDERRELGAKDEKDRSRDRPKSSRPSTARRRREKDGVIAP